MKKISIVFIILFFIIIFFQESGIHSYNGIIENLLWNSNSYLFVLIVLFLLLILYGSPKLVKAKWIIIGLIVIDSLFILLFSSIAFIQFVEPIHIDNNKLLLKSEQNWDYYVSSPRRSALDDLNIYLFREKVYSLKFFKKEYIPKEKAKDYNIDFNKVQLEYYNYYFSLKKKN